MRIHNTGRKHYYVYQDDKRVGKLTKKKNDLSVNNNSPVIIKRNSIIFEIVYYTILVACLVPCFIWARPVAILIFLLATRIYDPFNLDNKTNLYIKRPTGTIDLTDGYDFKTNADVILRRRLSFIHIRFVSIIASFTMIIAVLIELLFRSDYNGVIIGLTVVYAIAYIGLMYIYTKKYLKEYNNFKIEKEEQDKYLSEK